MQREGLRAKDKIRKTKIKTDFIKYPEGSCLIEQGSTKVICSASIEEGVPSFLKGTGSGWITAEYSMLPRSCPSRILRDRLPRQVSGRFLEIQRLIGRVLRAVIDLEALGERTIWIDADVIQADGGTRCCSITGCFVALVEALKKLRKEGLIDKLPVKDFVAAVSVGIIDGNDLLDLSFSEDSKAEVDMNVAMTSRGKLIEVQSTVESGEGLTLSRMNDLIKLAKTGIDKLISIQKEVLKIKQ
ncbi:MAG TPA: ribonuclease PH [Candidatus Omnitrophica bacterium]|nr:ribonuclease PH [Candidatus Omnitrophota bacterium]